jgi:hypothetical protein
VDPLTGDVPRLARWRVITTGAALIVLLAAASTVSGSTESAPTGEPADPVIRLPFGPPVGPDDQPPGWESLRFPRVARHTRYRVRQEGEAWVLRAEAETSASALYYPLDADPRQYRHLSWRWKVDRVLAAADARTKAGDDYPARLYVAFADRAAGGTWWQRATHGLQQALAGRSLPSAALNYVWDNRLPPGTVLDNAYTDRSKMIVLQSGATRVGEWVEESRDVYADYQRAFGREPPRLAGIAVMSDTDNTGERAIAWYAAITLRRAG